MAGGTNPAGDPQNPDQTPQQPTTNPETQTPTPQAATTAPVDARTNQTRSATAAVLTSDPESIAEAATEAALNKKRADAQRQSFQDGIKDTVKKLGEIGNQMQDVIADMGDEKLIAQLRSESPEVADQWEDDLRVLKREQMNNSLDKEYLSSVSSFYEGSMSPAQFLGHTGTHLEHLPYGFADAGTKLQNVIEMYAQGDGVHAGRFPATSMTEAGWGQLQSKDRQEIVEQMLRSVNIDTLLGQMNQSSRKIKKLMQEQAKFVKKATDAHQNILDAEANAPGFVDMIKGIRFYSIMNYVEGAKKYWEALKTVWEQRGERYSATFAEQIGTALESIPIYGKEVDRILDQQLEAKRSEETEAMKKQLESDGAKWKELFGKSPAGFFEQFKQNPNKVRGILEYAADHGLLYDIDDYTDHHNPTVYGIKLSKLCSDWSIQEGGDKKVQNYFTLLRGKNSSGRDHETDHGYKKEHDCESVPRFIELLEEEMDDHNLWAAAGVCKRAMERGLAGEVSPWLITTIMAKLEEYPELKKVAPVSFFDIIGKLSMYQTGFTLGWAKKHRKELRMWAKTDDKATQKKIIDKTAFGTFKKIEEDIIHYDSATDYSSKEGKQKMQHLVAQVLATQIVELPGGAISIYQDKFKDYRADAAATFVSLADPLKEDSDFATEDTEKPMLPEFGYKQVLAYQSTFDFKNESWAAAFMETLIRHADQLKAVPGLEDAYKNYILEVRAKFDAHFKSFLGEERPGRQLYTFDSSGKPLIAQLIVKGLLSWDGLEDIPSDSPSAVMSTAMYRQEVIEQIKEIYPAYYFARIHNKPPELTAPDLKGKKNKPAPKKTP